MIRTQNFLNKSNLIIFILLWVVLTLIVPIPVFGEDFQKGDSYERTTQARIAVEKAWDTYHDGALGGTLQSPKTQVKLEMDLHKSRALLAEAYDAEDRGDMKAVDKLIYKIMQITRSVITESKEPKK
jgi:membrane associated rhomboid family serine protease